MRSGVIFFPYIGQRPSHPSRLSRNGRSLLYLLQTSFITDVIDLAEFFREANQI